MLELIGILVVFGFVMAGSVAFDAWVIQTLYGWFIPVAFASAPALTIAQVAGVLLVFRGARGYKVPKDDPADEKKSPGEKLTDGLGNMVTGFVISLMTLGIGWCIRWFL